MKQKAFVILGTDTEVGKTVLTAGLLRAYVRTGFIAFPQKWVSTGDRFGFSQDMSFVLDMAEIERDVLISSDIINPYSFVLPASPHFAAKEKNKIISARRIKEKCKFAMMSCERLIIEGVGGALVPLNSRLLLIDIVADLKLPVILVVKNVLGAINHSLLTLESLKNRGVRILGLVFNNAFECPANIRKDNIETICKIGKTETLGILPYMGYIKDYDDVFDVILEAIESGL